MKTTIILFFAAVTVLSTSAVFADNPPVKKSKSGVCHPVGGTYYSRTKHYTAYSSMEACIKSGGRRAKK